MKNKNNKSLDDRDFLNPNGIASATECTGLVQTPPPDDPCAEAYEEIYNIPEQGNLKDIETRAAKNNLGNTQGLDGRNG